jgi:hypothetical protein
MSEKLDTTEILWAKYRGEYAGYAFTTYRTPIEMLEISELFGGRATVDALQATGLAVDTISPKDDFWVEYFDHLDRMANPRRTTAWSQGHDELTGLSGLRGVNFLLGPVVRGPLELRADAWNQNADTDFAHGSAVYVTGELLLQGLYDYQPALREGWAVGPETIAGYLTETFGLGALIEQPATYRVQPYQGI